MTFGQCFGQRIRIKIGNEQDFRVDPALLAKNHRARRRLWSEFGRGFRVPRAGPLFSTTGVT